MHSKLAKIHQEEILLALMNRTFFVRVYSLERRLFLRSSKKKYRVVSKYNTNILYQIWSFCYIFFNYANNKHTVAHTQPIKI